MHHLKPGPAMTYLKPLCGENPESCPGGVLALMGSHHVNVSLVQRQSLGFSGPFLRTHGRLAVVLLCPHYTLIEEAFQHGGGLLAELCCSASA